MKNILSNTWDGRVNKESVQISVHVTELLEEGP